MDIPSPPTKSLWIFILFLGLFIAGSSLYFPLRFAYEVQMEWMELKAEVEKWRAEVENAVALQADLAPLWDRSAQITFKTDRVCSLITWRDNLLFVSWIGTPVGFAIAVFGIIMWYMRVQRYQDALLKNAAAKSLTGIHA